MADPQAAQTLHTLPLTTCAFLGGWQTRKQETITHPFLNEKLPWGLVPYVQALLLARTLRGDMELYPPFFWK